MIFRARPETSKDAIALRSLLARVRLKSDEKKIKNEIKACEIGHSGERDTALHLSSFFARKDEAVILHDLRFEDGDDIAQIDHLVITAQRIVFVVETKRLYGRIVNADRAAWKITYGSKSYVTDSPGKQVERHARHVRELLKEQGSGMVEVIPLVSISQKERQVLSGFDVGPEMVQSTDLPVVLQRRIETSLEARIDQRPTANIEEMIGCAWLLEQKHVDRAVDWETRLRLQLNPPSQLAMTVEGEGEKPQPAKQKMKPGDKAEHITVPGGKLRATALDEGILLQWRGAPEHTDRFDEKCRAHPSALWDVPSTGWILSREDARKVTEEIKKGCLVTTDMFSAQAQQEMSEIAAEKERPRIEKEAIARSRDNAPKIETLHGSIVAISTNIGFGPAYALRHAPHDLLAAYLRKALTTNDGWTVTPQWNKKYGNWVISQSDWDKAIQLLSVSSDKKRA